jgi:radical SAM superfamily enzyme YgiQ (UPF0313 family)
MKITLIKPTIGRLEHSLYVDEGRMEPLQLGVIAGLTPPDVECVLYDDRIEPIPYDDPTDLVAITVEIYTARRAYEIGAEFRARRVPVIMGGFQPTLLPEECLEQADSIYVGDAESLWPKVVEDARHGTLRRIYRGSAGTPQTGGKQPRRDLFGGKGYLPITLMQFGRGCRFRCDFCAVSAYFDHRHFVRPTSEILAEIESQERRLIFFVDDNFLSNHLSARRFLRELIPLKIRWVSQGSLDMTDDPELMDLMEASGCLGHVIGFESLDPRNVRAMRKAPNLRRRGWDRYRMQCEILRRHHLQTWAAFTFGHDWDTPESIRETLDFAMEQRFAFAAFNILMPYPGTPLHARLQREGRLLWDGRWWLHPEYRFNHAAFVPRGMTPDELTEACWYCRDHWNRPGSILRRAWDAKTHLSSLTRLGIYFTYNRLFARETYKKQGMRFGFSPGSINTTSVGPARRARAPRNRDDTAIA